MRLSRAKNVTEAMANVEFSRRDMTFLLSIPAHINEHDAAERLNKLLDLMQAQEKNFCVLHVAKAVKLVLCLANLPDDRLVTALILKVVAVETVQSDGHCRVEAIIGKLFRLRDEVRDGLAESDAAENLNYGRGDIRERIGKVTKGV
ncbi:hypothetical protein HYW82_00980 [Candidatus Peregrinibacteria bacterium]|nr:hypothetical protein [Candidatus Peregrinibacteria bacterium]